MTFGVWREEVHRLLTERGVDVDGIPNETYWRFFGAGVSPEGAAEGMLLGPGGSSANAGSASSASAEPTSSSGSGVARSGVLGQGPSSKARIPGPPEPNSGFLLKLHNLFVILAWVFWVVGGLFLVIETYQTSTLLTNTPTTPFGTAMSLTVNATGPNWLLLFLGFTLQAACVAFAGGSCMYLAHMILVQYGIYSRVGGREHE